MRKKVTSRISRYEMWTREIFAYFHVIGTISADMISTFTYAIIYCYNIYHLVVCTLETRRFITVNKDILYLYSVKISYMNARYTLCVEHFCSKI